MMPLCTTASRSVACGCALLSVGLPWVAQRVWPMPIVPLERLALQLGFEIAQLALGAPARQPAAFQRRDAGGVIAAIFEALERIDELHRDRLTAENADNSAHPVSSYPDPAAMIRQQLYMRHESTPVPSKCMSIMRRIKANGRRSAYSAAAALRLGRRLDAPGCAMAPPSLTTCRSRAIASASAGTSWVITEPVAT